MRDLLLRPTSLHDSGRMERITGVVLDLLFDLAQQSAPICSCPQPWASPAAYDTDDFAPFSTGGPA